MTKNLITRDSRNDPDSKVVIWDKAIKKDHLKLQNGVWVNSITLFPVFQAIEPTLFKKIFGWVPKSGSINYYRLRKIRKKKSPIKKLQDAIENIYSYMLDKYMLDK